MLNSLKDVCYWVGESWEKFELNTHDNITGHADMLLSGIVPMHGNPK